MKASPVDNRKGAQRVALFSLLAAIGLVAANGIAGYLSGSIALLSEAVHSSLDAGATMITYFAVRIASKPPDHDHPYGHGKAENISALLTTIFLFVLAIFIAREAVSRLVEGGSPVEATWYAFVVILLSMVVEATRARALRRAGKKYRSAALVVVIVSSLGLDKTGRRETGDGGNRSTRGPMPHAS